MSRFFAIGAVGTMCMEATRDLIETGGENELMLRSGCTFAAYSSHERNVEANKENY